MSGKRLFVYAAALSAAGLAATARATVSAVPLYADAPGGADTGAFSLVTATEPTAPPVYIVDTIGNPAEQTHAPTPGYPQSQPSDEGGIVHPWEMPAIEVVGQSTQPREDQLIGTYKQPVWTADRRFSEVRVYVQPEGSIGVTHESPAAEVYMLVGFEF